MNDKNASQHTHPIIAKALASTPIAELIGFTMSEIGAGRAVATLQPGPQHANPMGTLHGGLLCDLTDAAMGVAFASTLEPGQSFTTIELRINFFRPVWTANLTAEAIVIQRGRTTGYVECTVRDGDGKLVAKAASTSMLLPVRRANAA